MGRPGDLPHWEPAPLDVNEKIERQAESLSQLWARTGKSAGRYLDV